MRSPRTLLIPVALLAVTAACEQQAPMVYVLDSPQIVTLKASASTLQVQQGGTVVLHAERRSSGKWKQIPRDQLVAGQCWLYRPPAQTEAEVADNIHWEVAPEDTVRFNTDYRMDHARIATMMVKGVIKLTPMSAVKCEPDRVVEGAPIEIEVS